jgi:hypothetical protein
VPIQGRRCRSIAWRNRPALNFVNLDIRFFRDHRFAIFDPNSGLESPLLGMEFIPIRHPSLVLPAELSPRLIDLGSASSEVVGRVFDAIAPRLAVQEPTGIDLAFQTTASWHQVADHLGRQSVRQLGKLGKHLVRVWDPHVLMHLLWIWPAEELQRLFGPISRCSLFLPGEVISIEREDLTQPGLDGADQRHQALQDISILNAALEHMKWCFAEMAYLGPGLLANVEMARRSHKLHDEADLAVFALQANRWGVNFVTHPDIQAALTMAQDGETLYRDALAQIDERRMQRIEAELSA